MRAKSGLWLGKLHTRYHLARRFLHVTGVFLRQGTRAAARYALGRPLRGPRVVRESFEALGGAFVKLGQVLSLQVDLLPREYCDEMLQLLDRMQPIPQPDVLQVFQEELGASPDQLFREFEDVPIASASIGQVHRARLKNGTPVAVKVQRLGIDLVFERDNQLLHAFVHFIEFLRIRRLYFLRESVHELTTWTREELDYRREAGYCQLLGENARDVSTERIPKIYWDLTTARVLTMDYLEGPSVAQYLRMIDEGKDTEIERLRAQGFVPADFTSNIISNFLNDAFRSGAFHADLHPANLLILPGNVVGYVDFGIVAFLTPDARKRLVRFIRAYALGDIPALFDGLMNISTPNEDADIPAMRKRLEQVAPEWYEQPSVSGRVRFRTSATRATVDLLAIGREYGVFVDGEMIRYIRSVFFVDGLLTRLAPRLNMAESLQQAVEAHEIHEARSKVSSAGTILSLLTEAILWTEAGPDGVLRSLEALERDRFRAPDSETSSGDPTEWARLRTLTAALVWVVTMLAFGVWGCFPPWRRSPYLTILAVTFVLTWTAILLGLLRRMDGK